MKRRLVLTLAILVITPLAALAWLGARMIGDEEEALRRRFDDLAQRELRAIDATVQGVLGRWTVDLDRVLDATEADTAALRALVRKERTVSQVFVVDGKGARIHPPPSGPLNRSETGFLARTADIWGSEDSFFRSDDTRGGSEDGTVGGGWYYWYWGRGVHLIYWRRADDGRVSGVEVDRMALMADIVGELPDTGPGPVGALDGRIRIRDGSGGILYQWGPSDPKDGESPRVSMALSQPLGSWTLDYFPAGEAGAGALGRGIAFTMATGFGALVLAVLGLAIYFIRASGREIREAVQRVTFVNQVSHELKTPLTNIRMYAELLEDRLEGAEDAQAVDQVRVIASESRRLSRLIGNVLSFARQGRGKLTVRPAPGCVDDAVSEVIGQFRPSLEAKGVSIGFEPNAGGDVMFDSDALGQVLGNLLSNVEKYAASGGRVEVSTSRDGDRTVIEVADDGPGVPRAMHAKVFEPFFRVSGRVSDGVTGTGIGLSISRDLARLHGGDLVLVQSAKGARFRLTLNTPDTADGEV